MSNPSTIQIALSIWGAGLAEPVRMRGGGCSLKRLYAPFSSLLQRATGAGTAHLCSLLLQRLPQPVDALQVNISADVAAIRASKNEARNS